MKNNYQPDFLEIVFQGRNKEYGAYDLRRNYSKRIKFATLITLSIAVAISVLATTSTSGNSSENERVTISEVTLQEIKEKKKIEPPPVKKTAPPKVEMKRFTPPVIKEDKEVEKTVPPVEELADVKIATDDQEGIKDDRVVKPSDIDNGKDIVEEKPVAVENTIFDKVEIEASFPGGNSKWRQYLERNCNGQVATDNGAPEGTYTTIVQFVVDKEGNLSDVIALSSHGYGMEQEAIRVIKKGPKWNPAIQNGVQVKAYRKQLITFQVQSE